MAKLKLKYRKQVWFNKKVQGNKTGHHVNIRKIRELMKGCETSAIYEPRPMKLINWRRLKGIWRGGNRGELALGLAARTLNEDKMRPPFKLKECDSTKF